MTISGLGNGIYRGDVSSSNRETVFAGDLNRGILGPNEKANEEAEQLKKEWQEKQRRLEGVSSVEGLTPERRMERIRALQEGIGELRNTYNKVRQFRIPEEMKENAKRFAEAIKKAFPQPPSNEEEEAEGIKALGDTANESEEEKVLRDGIKPSQEEQKGLSDRSPRITENIFDKPQWTRTDVDIEDAVGVKEKKPLEVEEDGNVKRKRIEEEKEDENDVGAGKEIVDVREENVVGFREENESEEEKALRENEPEAGKENKDPRITEYLFDQPERGEMDVRDRNIEEARMGRMTQWDMEAKLTA